MVVDKATEEFFHSYGVAPTSRHLDGEVVIRNLARNRSCDYKGKKINL